MENNKTLISCSRIGKCYRIYDDPKLRLKQAVLRGSKKYYREFWALKEVNLEVQRGETLGIIGSNGSGKSTLLQIICGILQPTQGNITTNGRISALLELGSGFNPEFSGRENIFLNAAILGLSNHEVNNRLDKILGFADIGEFIEQPIKSYSSGMVVRLAFAIAINIDPKILIIDEALSVGDEKFQRKCFSKIETIKESGAAVLFVSHSSGAIIDLCDNAILLDAGEHLLTGSPKKVIGCYQKLLYAPSETRTLVKDAIIKGNLSEKNTLDQAGQINTPKINANDATLLDSYDKNLQPSSTISYESNGAVISEPQINTLDGIPVNNITKNKVYTYRYRVKFTEKSQDILFGMLIKTTNGTELGGSVTERKKLMTVEQGDVLVVEFEFLCCLNPGTYFVNAGIQDGFGSYLHRLLDATMFRVNPEKNSLSTGTVDFKCSSNLKIID